MSHQFIKEATLRFYKACHIIYFYILTVSSVIVMSTCTMSLSARRPWEDTLTSSPSSSSIAKMIERRRECLNDLELKTGAYLVQYAYTKSAYIPSNSAGPTPTIMMDRGSDAACPVNISYQWGQSDNGFLPLFLCMYVFTHIDHCLFGLDHVRYHPVCDH